MLLNQINKIDIMLSPRLTDCKECANIPSLLKKIDCKLAELGNSLYNNISYMLNKPIPAGDILQLIAYRRILMHKYCNPNYVHEYSVAMIASRVIRLTLGCVSRCNEPERCLEEPCDIKIVPNPTTTSTSTLPITTTTTSSSSTSTSTTSTTSTTTTAVPTTTTTSSSSSTSTTTSTSSSTSTTTSTTTVVSTQWIIFASANPYSACQQVNGQNVTVYTSTPFLGNGVTLYLDAALTIPYVSDPFANNILSNGTTYYFLGDNGGAVIINSGSCQGFGTTTTTTTSSITINPNYSITSCDTSGGFQIVTLINGSSICDYTVYLQSSFSMLPTQFYITYQGFSRLFEKDITNQFAYPQGDCIDCSSTTTTTSSSSTTTTTTTLPPTTTTTTTIEPLRYFYNATFYNCGDCVTPSGAGSFNNSQPLTAGMYYINSSGIIIYINSFNSVSPGISVNNILDSSQQVNCGDIVCPTTTTTTTLILSTCTVFINNFSVTGNILAYDPVTNQSNELTTLPFSQDIATTANKLWIYDTFTAQIAEYNITLSPWSINFNRYINYPSGIYLGNGLGSIDDTTLITVDNSFNDIMKLDISGSTAVVTDIFGTLDAGYSVSGDILYTTTGKIICTVNSFDNTVLKLVQYDAVTGTKEVEVDLTYLLPAIALGVFEHLGKLYLATQSFKIYEVDLISPYTITLVNTITFGVSGASSAPSCSTVNLIVESTTTTTTTVEPTTTTTTSSSSTTTTTTTTQTPTTTTTSTSTSTSSTTTTTSTLAPVSSILGTTGLSPVGIILDSANNVYTANFNSGNVSKITPSGVSTIFANAQGGSRNLVMDSAGNIYVCNYFSNTVSKITPLGVSTVFGTTGAGPWAITIDPSENIYTANFDSSNVTKITPSGVSTIFASANIQTPRGIKSDSLGNIYVSNFGASKNVIKITPAGVSTVFATLTFTGEEIITDSSDNLYVVGSDRVHKITPAGVVTVLGSTSGNSDGITIDTLGNVYATSRGANNVVKITQAGVSTVFATTGNSPQGITIDTLGNLYVANYNSNNVTKITV